MSLEVLNKVETKYKKTDRPELQVGDIVIVNTIIRDGNKKRLQKFQGIVISISGKGLSKTFTVRKISYGVGVEKIFPLYSTNIESIKVVRHSKVRRSKLYYLRGRIGKAAMKLKAGKAVQDIVIPEEGKEVKEEDIVVEENPEEVAEVEVSEESDKAVE